RKYQLTPSHHHCQPELLLQEVLQWVTSWIKMGSSKHFRWCQHAQDVCARVNAHVCLSPLLYVVFSLQVHTLWYMSVGTIMEIKPPEAKTSVLQFAAWGPLGNQLVYIFESNIYYQQDTSSSALRLTSTGRDGIVLNGVSDWLYEEEVLQTYIAHWWSSDGARLAYLMINNTATPIMEIPQFLGGVYPVSTHYPYPKAGQPLPSVKLFVVNLYGPAHTLELISPDDFRNRECYIPMVMWISSTRLAVRWLNRAQNMSVLTICEATTGACVETGSDTWLIKQQEAPLFQQDGSVFFLTIPAKQGARGEFHHVLMLPSKVPSVAIPDVLCVHSANTMGGFHRSCLTCDLVANCSFFTAKFSPNKSYFMLRCEGETSGRLAPPQRFDGTPGSQSVTDHFQLDWTTALSSSAGVVVAQLDGRGGGNRAAAFSERYLGLPSKEESLYAATSLLGEAHKLKGEHFLLVHGTADAKVHFQHSAELLHHLILVEANYTLQVYPDEGHALQSERSRQHLQHTLHRSTKLHESLPGGPSQSGVGEGSAHH
uniref:Dipeptidylpeptidase IV N-terminal domain-containing protein n=1 Tax=Erpetoichthys calabaricus TaxID=27687 RepID=A0A8C4SCC7_ERPCA